MNEKYTLDILNQDGVSVSKQAFIDYQGQQHPIGEHWRRSYVNDASGRQQILDELPQAQVTAILAVWGDEPTIVETVQQ